MRIPECVLLVVLGTYALGADGDQNVGYVDCSTGDKHRSTPIFANPCISRVDGAERYIGIISISQKKNRFVALDLPAPTGQYVLDCSAFRTRTGKSLACAIDQKNPEYTQAARRAGVQGSVMLGLTIDIEGVARDIKVVKSLGYGLDEKAVEAVQQMEMGTCFGGWEAD